MIQFFKQLLRAGAKTDFKELINNGAVIIDVRTKNEFRTGNIKGSVNIPLDMLPNSLSKFNKNKPVIVCCASGMRSSSARKIMLSNGFTDVYNGGGWQSLLIKMRG